MKDLIIGLSPGALSELVRKLMKSTNVDKVIATNILGREYLRAAEIGDYGRIDAFIDGGFPINYQDRRNGETALHYAAASDARRVVVTLLATDACNYLLRDNWGRLPSELAYLYGRDPALARLLAIKERKQAEREGIKITRRPA